MPKKIRKLDERTHPSRPMTIRKHVTSVNVGKYRSEKGEDPLSSSLFADDAERSSGFAMRKWAVNADGKVMWSLGDVIKAVSDQDEEKRAHLKRLEDKPQGFQPLGVEGEAQDGSEATRGDAHMQFLNFLEELPAHHQTEQSTHGERVHAVVTARVPRSPASGFAWQRQSSFPSRLKDARSFHSTRKLAQQASLAKHEQDEDHFETLKGMKTERESDPRSTKGAEKEILAHSPDGIRAQLRKWNELHGQEEEVPDVAPEQEIYPGLDVHNNLTRLPDRTIVTEDMTREGSQDHSIVHAMNRDGPDGENEAPARFLHSGDLVELEYPSSERESVIAVFVRRLGNHAGFGQFFTMAGRWLHLSVKVPQYSIPGFISEKELEPIIKYLPVINTASDLTELQSKAIVEDLSVPRPVAAPLVAKLQAFYTEAQEVYRRNANALDNAHNLLAHETDLRYGSLESAAMALLKLPADKLPLTALFTVRKALTNGGFAFNIDRRSHRITGYMQIRSKEQVRMVEQVRDWIRQWQDDMARAPGMSEQKAARRNLTKGARILHNFVEKAKQIVQKQRHNRQPTSAYSVGPSRTRLPLTDDEHGCIKTEVELQFTEEEQEVIRFMEAWCCSLMFHGLPRILSLPPLILHATGLYNDIDGVQLPLGPAAGFLFLQEIGVVIPYENRVRFDQHLLLPSSQHSKPLQNLMASLVAMRDNHNFRDSMHQLRHDWGSLPVYCVDDASAKEIDDGISVEKAGIGPDGEEMYWLHMHIANPTAFFARDHPLAKMARHMGETVYMPERTYMMLPRWATQRHFSLSPNRPCLTFSAKLDSQGNRVDYKIQPGIVRNVIQLTYDEIDEVLGAAQDQKSDEVLITVGGTPPRPNARRGRVSGLSREEVEGIQAIYRLSSLRSNARRRQGGIFFNADRAKASVWQRAKQAGLSWDHPYRKGSRTVYGDPIVQVRTSALKNWFGNKDSMATTFVSEAMLLSSEIAASYCADRKIPIIFRGSERNLYASTDVEQPLKAAVAQEMLNKGEDLPMHLGLPYVQSLGSTVLRTTPLKHNLLGMDRYAKVTSPLRRYGDMIIHWQIEAALLHEAETGQSLVVAPDDHKTVATSDRSFLPFSTPVLDTIMLGLQPREKMILHAKSFSESFWQIYTLFHKQRFGAGTPEGSLGDLLKQVDPTSDGETVKLYIQSRPEATTRGHISGIVVALGLQATMTRPELDGLEEARQGDFWECKVGQTDVFNRTWMLTPLRLIARDAM